MVKNVLRKNDFCCSQMIFFLEENKVAIYYDKRKRNFAIELKGSSGIQRIFFCPWCGKRLPESLSDEFWDIIDKLEIDTSEVPLEDHPDMPEEFKSDEWWKKRGL